MKTKVKYTVLARTTKNQVGRVQIENRTYKEDDSYDAEVIGFYNRPQGGLFETFALVNGEEIALGDFATQSQAGHAARDAVRVAAKADDVVANTLSLEEAAELLSPDAKNPVAALKKKIARGSVETVVVNGETRVVKPAA